MKLTEKDLIRPYRIGSKNISVISVSEILSGMMYKVIDLDVYLPSIKKNLQRPLVWSDRQKEEYIWYLLLGGHPGYFSFVGTSSSSYESWLKVIDGKQRITTILSFVKGEFKILNQYFFNDLDENLQYKITGISFNGNLGWSYDFDSDEKYVMWFDDINFKGTVQDRQHIDEIKNAIAVKENV